MIHKGRWNFSKISSLFRIRFPRPLFRQSTARVSHSLNFAFQYKHPYSRERDVQRRIRNNTEAADRWKRTRRGYFGPFPTNGHPRSNKETWNIQRIPPSRIFPPSTALFHYTIPLASYGCSFSQRRTALKKQPATPELANSRSRKKQLAVYALRTTYEKDEKKGREEREVS